MILSFVYFAVRVEERGIQCPQLSSNRKRYFVYLRCRTMGNSRQIKLSNWVTDFKCIQLENSDTALVKGWRVYITDNYIGVLDEQAFKLFNHQGKFLCNIGRTGQGPGEYKVLYGATLNEKFDKICLAPFYEITLGI